MGLKFFSIIGNNVCKNGRCLSSFSPQFLSPVRYPKEYTNRGEAGAGLSSAHLIPSLVHDVDVVLGDLDLVSD